MDVASELTFLVACKLVVYSLGSLVHLFLMVLILGQRRLRRLEWLLFGLMVALFMWYSGNLLALNVGLFYGVGPDVLSGLARLIPFLGFALAAPLVVHVHAEYRAQFQLLRLSHRLLLAIFYFPVVATPWLVGRLLGHLEWGPLVALRPWARPLAAWLVMALVISALFNLDFRRRVQQARLVSLHGWLVGFEGFLALGLAWEYLVGRPPALGLGGYFPVVLMLVGIAPSALVGYSIFRYNFLNLRVQRNLVYSIVAIFALLIYLNVIRRLSGYLELHNILPSAVTEGVMIFLLVVLLEPIKKQINRLLHTAFVSEFERVQRLSDEIQEHAKRSGDLELLKAFVEDRIARELRLERVELVLGDEPQGHLPPAKVRRFAIHRGEETLGTLLVTPVTADLSGDLQGALQLLADQLGAALELCRLIAAKVQLERALAEKAKMAFLGEMATRIAHNVKNPLSSMKTLVQLLEADASLPPRVRQDCHLVVSEIDRLNNNISQVLRYAKSARDTDRAVDLAGVVDRVLTLARAEAERRQVHLEFAAPAGPCVVEGGEEAASDIVSNLVVNALEASPAGATVRIRASRETPSERVLLTVEDQGPGIAPGLREKIFQPFFTTRPGGTGLGLAIVARRLEEIGGEVECASPPPGGAQAGARFVVRLRAAR